MTERYELAKQRINELITEARGLDKFGPFFVLTSKYISGLTDIYEDIKEKSKYSIEVWSRTK